MALTNKNFLDQTKTNIWSYKDLNQMAENYDGYTWEDL